MSPPCAQSAMLFYLAVSNEDGQCKKRLTFKINHNTNFFLNFQKYFINFKFKGRENLNYSSHNISTKLPCKRPIWQIIEKLLS